MNDQKVIWWLAGCLGAFSLLLCIGGGVAFAVWSARNEPVAQPTSPTMPISPTQPVPPVGPGQVDMSARQITASVESVTGRAPVRVGEQCSFEVEGVPRPDGTYWCHTQIYCANQRLLYGGSNAGFFPCTLHPAPGRHVVGTDQSTTSSDGDSAITLNTQLGQLTIRDDFTGPYGSYTLTARVTGVR